MRRRGSTRWGGTTEQSDHATTDGGWRYIPFTVLAITMLAGLFTLARIQPLRPRAAGPVGPVMGLLLVVNRHVLTMFMHAGPGHYLRNALGLVLFGGALTALAGNRHVLGVILVTHAGGSFLHSLQTDAWGIGLSLAIAGVIAATILRTGATLAGLTPGRSFNRLVGGLFALIMVCLFVLTSVTGVWYLRIADHHVYGWVMGALAELVWLGWVIVRE